MVGLPCAQPGRERSLQPPMQPCNDEVSLYMAVLSLLISISLGIDSGQQAAILRGDESVSSRDSGCMEEVIMVHQPGASQLPLLQGESTGSLHIQVCWLVLTVSLM